MAKCGKNRLFDFSKMLKHLDVSWFKPTFNEKSKIATNCHIPIKTCIFDVKKLPQSLKIFKANVFDIVFIDQKTVRTNILVVFL